MLSLRGRYIKINAKSITVDLHIIKWQKHISKILKSWHAKTVQKDLNKRFYQTVLGTPEDLVVKSKLSPSSDSVALRQLNPIHKEGP